MTDKVYYRKRYREKIAQGLCSKCGKRPLHTKSRCRLCNSRTKSKYGLSSEEFEKLLELQENVCAICEEPCLHRSTLSVDHDHKTLAIRGLLCYRCNVLLGHARDNPEILEAAARYLRS